MALLAVLVSSAFVSCDRGGSTSAPRTPAARQIQQPAGGGEILATVNGVPISDWDVRDRLKNDSHTAEMTPQYQKNALEALVREELFRQRAVELGLDADAGYQRGLSQLEARTNAFQRKELARLFLQRETLNRSVVTEADAKKYFDANASRIRTELHVWQILKRGQKDAIDRALEDIRNGTPFEQVAARQFPGLPKSAGTPWDLGYLRWQQVPPDWRDVVYDLQPGEVSGVIRGARDRFWIVKLVDKRENREVTFESVRAIIIEVLRSEAAATLSEKTERALRDASRIVYHGAPAASGTGAGSADQ